MDVAAKECRTWVRLGWGHEGFVCEVDIVFVSGEESGVGRIVADGNDGKLFSYIERF